MDLAAALRYLDEHVNLEAVVAGRHVAGPTLERMQRLMRRARRPPARRAARSTSPAPTARARPPRSSTRSDRGPRPHGGHLHQPPPASGSTSASRATASPSATTSSAEAIAERGRRRGAGRRRTVVLRDPHRRRVPLVRRRGGRRRRGRGRAARPVGRHQRGRRPRSRSSPTSGSTTPSTPGRLAASTSPRRRPASSSRARRSCWARPIPSSCPCFLPNDRGETCRSATSTSRAIDNHARGRRPPARPAHAGRGATTSCTCPLHGAHQGDNAAAALAAVEAFFGRAARRRARRGGRSTNVVMPGRFEVVGTPSARAARRRAQPRGRRRRGGQSSTKSSRRRRTHLCGRDAERTRSRRHARGARRGIGAARDRDRAGDVPRASPRRTSPVLRCRSTSTSWWSTACRAAVDRALDEALVDDLILITGSLYVVGEARGGLVA